MFVIKSSPLQSYIMEQLANYLAFKWDILNLQVYNFTCTQVKQSLTISIPSKTSMPNCKRKVLLGVRTQEHKTESKYLVRISLKTNLFNLLPF